MASINGKEMRLQQCKELGIQRAEGWMLRDVASLLFFSSFGLRGIWASFGE